MTPPNASPQPSAHATSLPYERDGLQAFQARISERIAKAQSETHQTHALLSLDVGGYRLFISLAEIGELLPILPITTVALAKRWITGLAVARAEVVTVFDLAYCLDSLLPMLDPNWRKYTLANPTHPTNTTNITNKIADQKSVLLASDIAPQAMFVAEKVYGAVTPTAAAYQVLQRPAGLPEYVLNAWQGLNQQVHLELSLSRLLQSKAFNDLAS